MRTILASVVVGLFVLGLVGTTTRDQSPVDLQVLNPTGTAVVHPAGGTTVSGVILLAATVHGSKVAFPRVEFEVTGGSLRGRVIVKAVYSHSGWSAAWDTKLVPDGTYRLESVLYDDSGTSWRSAPVTFITAN